MATYFNYEDFYLNYQTDNKNIPTEQAKANIYELMNKVLIPIRQRFGEKFLILSGYRNKEVNSRVSDDNFSDHIYGAAVDITTTYAEKNKKLFNLIVDMSKKGQIECREIINRCDYRWIHISINHNGAFHKFNEVSSKGKRPIKMTPWENSHYFYEDLYEIKEGRFINNTPQTKEIWDNLEKLVKNVIEPITREYLKLYPSPTKEQLTYYPVYRCPKFNKVANGEANSDHMYGAAVDLSSPYDRQEDNVKLYNLICNMANSGKIQCRQIINEYNCDWIHVSINNAHNSYKNNEYKNIK